MKAFLKKEQIHLQETISGKLSQEIICSLYIQHCMSHGLIIGMKATQELDGLFKPVRSVNKEYNYTSSPLINQLLVKADLDFKLIWL